MSTVHGPSLRVSLRFDISEEDQVAEPHAYLKSKGAEISEENPEDGLHVDLTQIIEASDVCLKEDYKCDEQRGIPLLWEKLVRFQEGERPSLRLQLLSNLFHGMDKKTPVRYTPLVGPSSIFQLSWIKLENGFLTGTSLLHYEALVACKKIMVELLGSYMGDSASQARVDAHRYIVQALKDPNAFLSDHLLTLKPVKFVKGELMHDLLTIFVSNNKDFIDSVGLRHEQNMAKMRLLTFMGLAVENKEISFDTMQQELQIGADDVEAFVIDVVRAKMVYYKTDQTQRKVAVSHSTHQTFGKQQWQQLYHAILSRLSDT
uniref:PCI domain-containing protein n=1 Tax=Capra hircus TaxID=9925 RepID=A0A452F268_CAPHI